MAVAAPPIDVRDPQQLKDELLRVSVDPVYFLETYGKIRDPLRGHIPFEMWPHIPDLLEMWDTEPLTITLKSRQVGVSWSAAAYSLHRVKTQVGANILMLSKREDEAVKLLDKSKFIERNLPAWLRQDIKTQNNTTLEFAGTDSGIVVLPATEDAGRSEGATVVFGDEHAYHKWARANWAAIIPTIEAGGHLHLVSTANGLGNLYADIYRQARSAGLQMWEVKSGMWVFRTRSQMGFRCIFIPWSSKPGRNQDWVQAQHSRLTDDEVKQEYPSTPAEAFRVSGRTVFDETALDVFDPRVSVEEMPRTLAAIDGLKIYALPGQDPLPYRTEHLKKRDRPVRVYTLGADCSEGLPWGDFSCLVVLDATAMPYIEVAHYHGKPTPDQFAEIIDLVARQYLGIVGVERNAQGYAVLALLRNLWASNPTYVLYHEVQPLQEMAKNLPMGTLGRAGWNTSGASKSMIINGLDAAFRNTHILLSTAESIDEARVYQRNDDGSMGAPLRMNDDRVMATAISYAMRLYLFEMKDSGVTEVEDLFTEVIG